MIKVYAVCGMGLGTSVILKTRLREALDATGVEYQLDVTDASAVSGIPADLIFTSDELADRIRNRSAKVVIINNFMDREEIKRKAAEAVASLDEE